jgi:3-isopropylmalate/(R)-2-methylmalate dehydratase small subunit
MLRGKAFKFGDNISTDHICPGRYFHLRSNLPELAKHTLEDVEPGFCTLVKPGDFVVAGLNFGLGSSREHAAVVIKMAGVAAILAKSAARIFYRNAVNVGLPILICDTDKINNGDELDIDLANSMVKNLTGGTELPVGKFPSVMLSILEEGGLIPYIKKHGSF